MTTIRCLLSAREASIRIIRCVGAKGEEWEGWEVGVVLLGWDGCGVSVKWVVIAWCRFWESVDGGVFRVQSYSSSSTISI